jgi:hypothetical protein
MFKTVVSFTSLKTNDGIEMPGLRSVRIYNAKGEEGTLDNNYLLIVASESIESEDGTGRHSNLSGIEAFLHGDLSRIEGRYTYDDGSGETKTGMDAYLGFEIDPYVHHATNEGVYMIYLKGAKEDYQRAKKINQSILEASSSIVDIYESSLTEDNE